MFARVIASLTTPHTNTLVFELKYLRLYLIIVYETRIRFKQGCNEIKENVFLNFIMYLLFV